MLDTTVLMELSNLGKVECGARIRKLYISHIYIVGNQVV